MKRFKQSSAGAAIAALALTGAAHAQVNTANEVRFEADGPFDSVAGDDLVQIATSTTLSADKWYNIVDRTIVLGGASLTIPAGTVFASENPNNQPGTLVIARSGQIFAEGTAENPIIFTSRIDLQNWENDPSHPTGKDPRNRGVWRPGIFEWGSVAILGNARISDTRQAPNPTAFDAAKESRIEGLPDLANNVNFYGGLDDEDDSGVFKYAILSYGGDNFEPGTDSELNGISVGGTGRGTDFHHVEVFNNVDDGLEIFGGTMNVKNLLVWNIGDDSLDGDQGWRGKAQFVLLVQGASDAANQGSGFGDNGIEFDGTDGDTSAQPITAGAIWNATVIGAPATITGVDSSDGLWATRDNLNLQIFNSIFMTSGETGLKNDGDDGDGSFGFGAGGTLNFADRWVTPASYYTDPANGFPNQGSATAADFEAAYTAQDPDFNLLSVAGTVFYDVALGGFGTTYSGTNGVTGAAASITPVPNAALDNAVVTDMPIAGITRSLAPPFGIISSDGGLSGDGQIANVTSIDPRAANDADAAIKPLKFQAPVDGFYTQANFRGAVAPNVDWTQGWTAISAIENNDGDKILASPANPDADATALNVQIAPAISFSSVDGVLYEVVAIDGDGNEQIIATVEGDGGTITGADLLNAPLNASLRYEVRVATLGG